MSSCKRQASGGANKSIIHVLRQAVIGMHLKKVTNLFYLCSVVVPRKYKGF